MERERSAAAAMLGLPGFVVLAVSDFAGEVEQAIETTVDLVGCPDCGAVAQLHDRRPCWVRDLPAGVGRLPWYGSSESGAAGRCCAQREGLDRDLCGDRAAGVVDRTGPRRDLPPCGPGRGLGRGVARDLGIGWRTAMAAVSERGTPRVDDPSRLDGVEAVGLDETACQAASATRSTSFVTGIVDLTRRPGGSAWLLDVVDDRSASALVSWITSVTAAGGPVSAV